MHPKAKAISIEGAARLASDDLTNQAPLYEYWKYADGVLRNMVIGKTKDQLREFWQPARAEICSPEWYRSMFELDAMAKDIFYNVLEDCYQKYEAPSDVYIRGRKRTRTFD